MTSFTLGLCRRDQIGEPGPPSEARLEVPNIDCDAHAHSERQIAAAIDLALSEVGFMTVRNLGMRRVTLDSLFETSRRFFFKNSDDKTRCAYGAALENFGYQGFLAESLDPSAPADLKESFTMRNVLANTLPESRWPDSEFRDAVMAFYQEAVTAASRLQRLLGMALDVPEDYFVKKHSGENITLRLLHYPPVAASQVAGAQMGAGAHTDYGMLTLLFQDAVAGLQVRSDAGVWIDVPPQAGAVVVNSGDLLERWSNGRYRSTCHRVLPQSEHLDRYSIALFVDPDSSTVVEALPSCVSEERPARYAATTAGQHLQEKIEATHLA
ncbi:MAG: isopenicillin N synthase family dioxygenase [Congregibacter sp.]